MGEPYKISIFLPDGDPEGAKIVELPLRWPGVGIAFPRSGWPQLSGRKEFRTAGVYVLTGSAEGDDELPTVYVGQGDRIGVRIDSHYTDPDKDFWDWGYAFVSNGNAAESSPHYLAGTLVT